MFFKVRISLMARMVLVLVFLGGMLGSVPAEPVRADTLIVTNTNDSGPGSLFQAISDALPGDTIMFASSLAGETIALHSLYIAGKTLTIDGSGLSPQIVFSGQGVSRIMQLVGNADVTLKNLSLTNGYSTRGGAIDVTGSSHLTLQNCALYQNHSTSSGGAISFSGTGSLTIIDTTFNQNQADGSGGALSTIGYGPNTIVNGTFFDNRADGSGGAIYAGYLTLKNTTLRNNHALSSGGAVYAISLTMSNTTIYLNQAGWGGAIAIAGNGFGTIVNSTISQNQASELGGAIFTQGLNAIDVLNNLSCHLQEIEGSG